MASYRLIRMFVAFAVAVLVARYLGPEQYGMLSYALALVMLVMGITGPGMKDVVTRQLSVYPARRPTIIRATFRLMLLLNSVTLVFAFILILLLRPDTQQLWLITAIIGFCYLFCAFEAFELWYHFRLKMSSTVLVQAASFFTLAAAKLLMIWWDAGLIWIAAAAGGELVLTGIGFRMLYRKDPPAGNPIAPSRSWHLEKLIFQKSLPTMTGFLCMTALFKADQLMLGHLVGDAEVGFYAIAVQFSEYWLYLAGAFVLASYPNLLQARQTGKAELERHFSRLCAILLYGAGAIALAIWLIGEWIILLLLGEAFSPSARMLSIHIWAVFFVFLMEALKKYYVIENLLIAYLKVTGSAVLINIALNFWLIPLYGGVGAAWATVISYGAAGYGLLWVFAETRPAATLITKSVLQPFKWLKNRPY